MSSKPSSSRQNLTRLSSFPVRAAWSWGDTWRQPAERQEAHSGTHTLPAKRQLHVPALAAASHSSTAPSTDTGAPAHTGNPLGPERWVTEKLALISTQTWVQDTGAVLGSYWMRFKYTVKLGQFFHISMDATLLWHPPPSDRWFWYYCLVIHHQLKHLEWQKLNQCVRSLKDTVRLHLTLAFYHFPKSTIMMKYSKHELFQPSCELESESRNMLLYFEINISSYLYL